MASAGHALPIICTPNAIPARERAEHQETTQRLFSALIEMQEIADGYAFRLPADSIPLKQAGAFIANERLCCPFLRFGMAVEPGEDSFWIRLTGPEGVKAFLRAEIPTEI
jgi:hypothetical protein